MEGEGVRVKQGAARWSASPGGGPVSDGAPNPTPSATGAPRAAGAAPPYACWRLSGRRPKPGGGRVGSKGPYPPRPPAPADPAFRPRGGFSTALPVMSPPTTLAPRPLLLTSLRPIPPPGLRTRGHRAPARGATAHPTAAAREGAAYEAGAGHGPARRRDRFGLKSRPASLWESLSTQNRTASAARRGRTRRL